MSSGEAILRDHNYFLQATCFLRYDANNDF